VGGIFGGVKCDDVFFRKDLIVDYVRVYK